MMCATQKIGFLTDSSCDLPQSMAEQYNIEVVGFPIFLEGKEYIERRDVTNEQFYALMRQADGVPTTAAITPLQWVEIYSRYVDAGYTDLIHVCINGAGSATYQNALNAVALLDQERPNHGLKLRLVDSHTYSMAFGWYLCECARKIQAGGDVAECVLQLEQKLAGVEICLAAYSLKQMKKSGRVSAAAAVAGDLLGIRPIISLNDGVSKVEAKVRGDANVTPAMVKWVKSRVADVREVPYQVLYTSSTARRDELVKLCKKEFGHAPIYIGQLGGVVSANTGPDALAIIFEGKPRRVCGYTPVLP